MRRQLGVRDRFDHRMIAKKRDDLACVVHVSLHAKRQRFEALQQEERRVWAHAGAEIAQSFATRTKQKRRDGAFFCEVHAVKPDVRLRQRQKFAARQPVERTAIDQHAADRHAVTADEFRRRVIHEVGAVIERCHQVRRSERRINQQRQAVVVGDGANRRNVEHVQPRVAERLAEQQSGVGTHRGPPRIQIARVDKSRVDTKARQGKAQQVV